MTARSSIKVNASWELFLFWWKERRVGVVIVMNITSSRRFPKAKSSSFTLVELLVVISIIGLLAGLGFPAISGAIKAGKKAEVAGMAESIKTAVNAFYSEYSSYPSNNGITDSIFLTNMSTTNTNGGNLRGIAFLEVPAKFTNEKGLVTPSGFYSRGARSNFFVLIDTGNLGYVNPQSVSSTLSTTNVPSSVAVWVLDPSDSSGKKAIGTFK
jgi:prepilin-type N-terminal cleavage/methylation domain-containing protein